jgi:hypothetical protein
MFERAVVRFFRVVGKTACGQLPALEMIGDAFATDAFFGAGFVRTIAFFQIFLFIALHEITPLRHVGSVCVFSENMMKPYSSVWHNI